MSVAKEPLAKSLLRDVPDFPKPGITFKDVSPILHAPAAFQEAVDLIVEDARSKGAEMVIGIESRGFAFGTPVALGLGVPFAMARKLGRLPFETVSQEYPLEFGTNTAEMHADAVSPGQRVYVVDDLLASGATAAAVAKMIERVNAHVAGFGFVVELGDLGGRRALVGHPIYSVLQT